MNEVSARNQRPNIYSRLWQSNLCYSFRSNPVAVISMSVFLLIVLLAVFSPFIAPINPHDATLYDIIDSDLPPVWIEGGDDRFIFGTDDQGRDLWSAILYGTKLLLIIGICAVLVQAFLGISIGLISGYVGGRIDSFLMRMADIQLSFSTLMVAIILLAVSQTVFGSEVFNRYAITMLVLVLVIGVAEWPQYARTVRATVLAEKKKAYVDAARVLGLSAPRIMVRHILPNTLSPIFVISTVQIANAIISEAALSFLGLGMPPSQPSLGSLISTGFHYIFSGSWWITVIPGIFLVVIVLVVNLLGDWLRDALNPRLYKG